jgi:hypothetical protein
MAHRIALASCSATVALLLIAGCDKPPSEVPAPSPAEAPAADPSPVPAPASETPPTDTPADPAQPEATPPPPAEPSAVPKPTATEPALETMRVARAGAKISVAVDLRYQFEADPQPGQPVQLHLAAVPRVGGTNLRVSVKPAAGLQLATGKSALQVQKASARGVYRQQMSVTRSAAGPESLRVLVTMDMPEGRAFGYYSIPLTAGTTAQKLDSVKQR